MRAWRFDSGTPTLLLKVRAAAVADAGMMIHLLRSILELPSHWMQHGAKKLQCFKQGDYRPATPALNSLGSLLKTTTPEVSGFCLSLMCPWSHQRTQIHSNSKRIIVEVQRNTAAVIKFKIQVIHRLEVEARLIAVVARKRRAACCHVRTGETLAVGRCAGRTALSCRATAENPAYFGLISPRRNVIRACLQTERALVVFQAAGERGVVTETHERPRKILCVRNRVADSRIQERRPITESAVEMVAKVPGCMSGAESLFGVSDGPCQVNRGTVIQGWVGIIE